MEEVLVMLNQVKSAPDALLRKVESLRRDMEQSTSTQSGFRSFGLSQNTIVPIQGSTRPSQNCWKSSSFQNSGNSGNSSFTSNNSASKDSKSTFNPNDKSKSGIKYQSLFKKQSEGSLDDKILNTVIGNKLNAFTQVTYNDTRDFIYQIIDSGETEFIKDFLEKVFQKATVEDKYCYWFARLIAEIAHRYPIIYDEMTRYNKEFLKVFDSVCESATTPETIKQRQYRLGYGQFISELASQNALNKIHLLDMIIKVTNLINTFSIQSDKNRSVEELIDCIIRLLTSLKEKSSVFFTSVQADISSSILNDINIIIDNSFKDKKSTGDYPSVSMKAWCRLKDLRDILVDN